MSDAPTPGAAATHGPLPGLRDPLADAGQSPVLDLPAEGSGSPSPLASAPTEPRFAGFWVTERELRAMAAGELPARLIVYCGELVEWLDAPDVTVRRTRR